ncbi:pilus assembly protein [Xanthomonas campestris]|uniref:pilus assembly protein n=1 Tax=Xanthomonas campestris TaxID=339 RepID=UPI001F394C04|nr:PilC/PilY family type IV pilus protein [Xanthomonas campestris]MCF8796759.1 pilus assembly protein [Xanthomonas campestris pv. campestris]MCF8814257.1 pilus assembly protein [Xanthomonas campestris pv. campestris]WHO90570.1 PilC/PilY family type IV pilus protein [Xanthomonas campestris]
MPSRKVKLIAASTMVSLLGLGLVYMLVAAQGQGILAQEPLNNQLSIPPAFIMAVDDSGSMTFQTQFPGADGQGCWSTARESFFSSAGALNTSGLCGYNHVMVGPRIDTSRLGVPPIDLYGFARSAAYNPTYYNPRVVYDPWIKEDGKESWGDASTTATRIDPRPTYTATVNLTQNLIWGDRSDSSRMQNGMVIPVGTRYRVYSGNNLGGTQTANGSEWTAGPADVLISTVRSVFFTPYTSNNDPFPVLPGSVNAYNSVDTPRIRVANACGQGCDLWKYTINASSTDALRNFANWFSFYGNRNKAIVAGLTRSLVNVRQDLRVGYFRINQHASFDSVSDALPMRTMGNDTQRKALYAEMIALTASGGTPNREAVNAAGIQFQRTDTGSPIQFACQKNAVMLFTDGYNNNPGGSAGATNAQGDGGMGPPFSDTYDNTMGDIAAKYYNDVAGRSPLRPDLPAGLVPVPSACAAAPSVRLDCQKNLHINFYGVTLGARGNLFNPDIVQDAYTDAAIYRNWPARSDNDPATVDDIWHAAINTRGDYINARTPADVTAAIDRVITSVTAGESPSGTAAQTGARIGNGSFAVAPAYQIGTDGTDWYSRLIGSRVSLDPQSRLPITTPVWEASARLAAMTPASRNIIVNEAGVAAAFNDTSISLADLCSKPAGLYPSMSKCSEAGLTSIGATARTAIAYLRGDPANEVRNSGGFRDRTSRLGDIINSAPVISAPMDDYGYRALPDALGTTYGSYLSAKSASGRYTVYVGANDGMLHAFDAGMTADGSMDASGGLERFAYIPATALGHMGNLLLPSDPTNRTTEYEHRYYVDGPVVVGDANYAGSWKTVVVGTAGAGGRSIFALDVTNPSNFSTSSKLWEISDLDYSLSTAIRNNIGHVLGKPVIVPVKNAAGAVTWKAIFGNGYNSRNGKAVLFVVDIKTGAPAVTMIEATETGSTIAGSNGLGNIVVVDRWGGASQTDGVRDGYADTVYGADQKGAIWKFDLRSSAASVTVPFFTTRTSVESGQTYRQPITGGLVATAGDAGGVMLFFGTGSFSFESDPKDEAIQSLYGVNDTVRGAPLTTATRANLRGSTVVQDGDRTLSRAAAPANSQGWYVDLPAKERMVGSPSIASGIVFIPTYTPAVVSSGCKPDGANWLFGLDTRTGDGALMDARKGSPTGASFASRTAATPLTTSGNAPVKDVGVSAIPRLSPAESGSAPGGQACWMVVTAAGSGPLYIPYPCGRQSWRQVQ